MKDTVFIVRRADDLTPNEIIEGVERLARPRPPLPFKATAYFEMESGRETHLSPEFPYPDVFEEVRRRLTKVGVNVSTRIRSWQDPEHEEQQAAWCLVVIW
jgi:hypothetical protein